jgi:hypothetical protein
MLTIYGIKPAGHHDHAHCRMRIVHKGADGFDDQRITLKTGRI